MLFVFKFDDFYFFSDRYYFLDTLQNYKVLAQRSETNEKPPFTLSASLLGRIPCLYLIDNDKH